MSVPNLNEKQLDRLSEIYMGIGLVAIASLAIPALIDRFNSNMLILSSVISILFWMASLYILKDKND